MVEVEAVERVELGVRHGRLVGERTGFEDHDESTGSREGGRDDAAARPGPDDDGVGLERDGLVRGGGGRRRESRDADRGPPGGDRWRVLAEPDRGEMRVGQAVAARGVGEERQELAESREGRAALRDARTGPAEQVAFAGVRAHRREPGRAPGQGQVGGPRVHRAQDESEERELFGIGGLDERLPGERRPALGVADDERLGESDEDRHLPLGPAGGHAPGRSHPCAGHGSQRSGRSSR